jgi:hypothetical protein
MIPLIQFGESHDAYFMCPKSNLDGFQAFLKSKAITVFRTKVCGVSHGEPYYMIEVEDIDESESKELISIYIRSLGAPS